jgi:hypothetical protein
VAIARRVLRRLESTAVPAPSAPLNGLVSLHHEPLHMHLLHELQVVAVVVRRPGSLLDTVVWLKSSLCL